jgi:hypothetical protein
LEPKDGKIAGLGNATVDIKGIGVVKFTNGAELNDVLFAPNAANLISISAATKRGGSFSFVGDGAAENVDRAVLFFRTLVYIPGTQTD